MGRKKTRLYPVQLPVGMVEHDACMMEEDKWQATYGPVFGTRERAREMAAISSRNRRPFIVVPITEETHRKVMELMEKEVSHA